MPDTVLNTLYVLNYIIPTIYLPTYAIILILLMWKQGSE